VAVNYRETDTLARTAYTIDIKIPPKDASLMWTYEFDVERTILLKYLKV